MKRVALRDTSILGPSAGRAPAAAVDPDGEGGIQGGPIDPGLTAGDDTLYHFAVPLPNTASARLQPSWIISSARWNS